MAVKPSTPMKKATPPGTPARERRNLTPAGFIERRRAERRQTEQALHIAAIAFEGQEGIAVLDASLNILRVNQAFTQITGYDRPQEQGIDTILRSDPCPATFHDTIWQEAQHAGLWQGELRLQRKNGQHYPAQVTLTAIRDEVNQITHYVTHLTDITHQLLQEQQRLINENAQRNALVREVHHRIKNNLQGITGLLHQFARQHPETAVPLKQAISQVQGISVIHGLQGRADTSTVRLCEMTGAIADELGKLWQTPITVDTPPRWTACIIAEAEAVPIALVLNELIMNAVKHGGKAHGTVRITLRKGAAPDVVQITIVNTGQLSPHDAPTGTSRNGLQLITALLPRHGASLVREQQGDQVMALLELAPPVISLDLKEHA